MGDYATYDASGGFKEFLYHDVGDIITADNGIQGKVINGFLDPNDETFHESLPLFSGKSEVYFKKSDEGDHPIEQVRVYKDRHAFIDIDWGHTHKSFKSGTVHVHEWVKRPNGTFKRLNPRYASNEEIARYGDLIRKANPNVRLR
jgi:hypothetical protein